MALSSLWKRRPTPSTRSVSDGPVWLAISGCFVRRARRHHSDMPSRWITQAQAAELAGCSRHTIERYLATGRIRRRYPRGRKPPTIDRASAEEFATWWAGRAEAAERARAERSGRWRPPTDGEVWLDVPTAALVAGVSRQYLAIPRPTRTDPGRPARTPLVDPPGRRRAVRSEAGATQPSERLLGSAEAPAPINAALRGTVETPAIVDPTASV